MQTSSEATRRTTASADAAVSDARAGSAARAVDASAFAVAGVDALGSAQAARNWRARRAPAKEDVFCIALLIGSWHAEVTEKAEPPRRDVLTALDTSREQLE